MDKREFSLANHIRWYHSFNGITVCQLKSARRNFYLGRGIVQENPGQVVCYIDYAYGNDGTIARLMEYNNAIRHRIPYVLNVITTFVIKLKEFNLIHSMESITAAGFCLGGHMAGMFGRWLGSHYKEPTRMVLGKWFEWT